MTIQPAAYTRIRGCPIGTDKSIGGRIPHPGSHEVLLHGGPAAGRLMAVPCPAPRHVEVITLAAPPKAMWVNADEADMADEVETIRWVYRLTGPSTYPDEPSHYWLSS